MSYLVAILAHDFLGKIEMMAERETFEEAERIAQAENPFAPEAELSPTENGHYSAIIWEGKADMAYTGELGAPMAIFYRGKAWWGQL
jgi:hypothetical protein